MIQMKYIQNIRINCLWMYSRSVRVYLYPDCDRANIHYYIVHVYFNLWLPVSVKHITPKYQFKNKIDKITDQMIFSILFVLL